MVTKDKFVRGSAILFIAMMFGNIFGYLFQLSMGRMLSVSEYGAMNALMSLIAIAGIPFSTIVNLFSRETSILFVNNRFSSIKRLHHIGATRLWLALIPILLVPCFFSGSMATFLGVEKSLIFMIIFCIYITGPVMVNTGIIQGLQSFIHLSVITGGMSVFKFIYAFIFVWIGWGLYGAIGSLLVTAASLLILSQIFLKYLLPDNHEPVDFLLKNIIKYGSGLFLANAFFSIMTQADIILVKHYFTPQEAGLYSSSAIMGKAVMYLPTAIVLALFPMTAAKKAKGSSSKSIILKATVLTAILSGSGALSLYVFSEFFTQVLFGSKYAEATEITALFGFAMLPMAFLFLLMNYLLAQGNTRFVVFLGISLIFEILGIHFMSNRLENILYIILFSGLISAIPLFIIVLYQKKSTT